MARGRSSLQGGHRATWERQQQLAALVQHASLIPASTASKVLQLATQLPLVLQQLQHPGEEGAAAHTLRLIAASDVHGHANACLVVCMLARACWSAVKPSDQLGLWHTWRLQPDALCALTSHLGWDGLLCGALHWLPQLADHLASVTPPTASLVLQQSLLRQLAERSEHRIRRPSSGHSQEVLRGLQALESALLQWGSQTVQPGSTSNAAAVTTASGLQRLMATAEVRMAAFLEAASSSISGLGAGQEGEQQLFQALCQLRARIALTLPSHTSSPSDSQTAPAHEEALAASARRDKDPSTVSAAATDVWQSILYPGQRTGTGDAKEHAAAAGTADPAAQSATLLAAWAAVTALFGDAEGDESAIEFRPLVQDPNPVSPARVTWAVLRMLRHAVGQAGGWQQAGAALGQLCWGMAAWVRDGPQQTALLELALLDARYSDMRTALSREDQLHRLLAPQLAALTNRLSAAAASGGVEVFGEQVNSAAEAASALFPAALLCPAPALERLLGDLVQRGGQAALFVGMLRELAPLAAARTSPASEPDVDASSEAGGASLLLSVLARRMAFDETASTEGGMAAVAECCLALCRPTGSGAGAALVDPGAMLLTVAVPALEEAHSAGAPSPVHLRLASDLLQPLGGGAAPDAAALAQRALAPAAQLLDFASRRVDVSSAGLSTPMAVLEAAQELAHSCNAVLSAAGNAVAAAVPALSGEPFGGRNSNMQDVQAAAGMSSQLQRACDQVCAALEACAAAGTVPSNCLESAQGWPLPLLRQSLVLSCAVVLPCCTPAEAERVLGPAGLEAFVDRGLRGVDSAHVASPPADETAQGAAAFEVACRALHSLALLPDLVPLCDGGGAAADTPCALRRIAVARTMQHVATRCYHLVTLHAPSAELAVRLFRELCRCVAPLEGFYDCAALRVGLLQLVQACGRQAKDEAEGFRGRLQEVAAHLCGAGSTAQVVATALTAAAAVQPSLV